MLRVSSSGRQMLRVCALALLLAGCSHPARKASVALPAPACADRSWKPAELPAITNTEALKAHDREATVALSAADKRAECWESDARELRFWIKRRTQ